MVPSRCIPASIENNVLSVQWSSDADRDLYMVRIYIGIGGLSGVGLCRPVNSKLCSESGTGAELEGVCPLNGTLSLRLEDGLHVIHVLEVSKDGRPAGAHENILLQVRLHHRSPVNRSA